MLHCVQHDIEFKAPLIKGGWGDQTGTASANSVKNLNALTI